MYGSWVTIELLKGARRELSQRGVWSHREVMLDTGPHLQKKGGSLDHHVWSDLEHSIPRCQGRPVLRSSNAYEPISDAPLRHIDREESLLARLPFFCRVAPERTGEGFDV